MKQKKKKAVKNYEMRNLLWKYFPENIFVLLIFPKQTGQ